MVSTLCKTQFGTPYLGNDPEQLAEASWQRVETRDRLSAPRSGFVMASPVPSPPPERADRFGIAWLKQAAKKLKKQVKTLCFAINDPQIGWLPSAVVFIIVAYALSPIDLIPDFIPVLGFLDDVILLPGLIFLAIKLIPEDVYERAQHRAEHEPVLLSKNWVTAVIILSLYDALLMWLTYWLINHFDRTSGRVVVQYQWAVLAAVLGLVLVLEAAYLVHLHRKQQRKLKKKLLAQQQEGMLEPLLADEESNAGDVSATLPV